jgi:hypothetical protein
VQIQTGHGGVYRKGQDRTDGNQKDTYSNTHDDRIPTARPPDAHGAPPAVRLRSSEAAAQRQHTEPTTHHHAQAGTCLMPLTIGWLSEGNVIVALRD